MEKQLLLYGESEDKYSIRYKKTNAYSRRTMKFFGVKKAVSGDENIRVKILESSKTSAKNLGIDEPFKGLSSSEIYKVVMFLESLRKTGKTIVVIDHTDEVNRFFVKQIMLKNNNGVLSELC